MTTFAVYETNTGVLKSVGSVLANPLPAGLTSVALSDPDAVALSNGTGRWDPATRTVVPTNLATILANQADLLAKTVNAIAGNVTALAAVPSGTTALNTTTTNTATVKATAGGNTTAVNNKVNALCDEVTRGFNVVKQMLVEQERALRQLTTAEKLAVGDLNDTTGT